MRAACGVADDVGGRRMQQHALVKVDCIRVGVVLKIGVAKDRTLSVGKPEICHECTRSDSQFNGRRHCLSSQFQSDTGPHRQSGTHCAGPG